MDVDQDHPIVIYSDDEDDDDVMLVKEEKVAKAADKTQEDDVIFISEKPSPFELKCRKDKNKSIKDITALISEKNNMDIACSNSHVGYFESAFSSLNLVNDILRPLGIADPVVLTSDTMSSVIKQVTHIKTSQATYDSMSEPEQGQLTHYKSDDDIEINSFRCLHDLDSYKDQDNSALSSTSSEPEMLLSLKFKSEGGSSKTTKDLNSVLHKIDVAKDCFNLESATTADSIPSSSLICTGQSSPLNDEQNMCAIFNDNGVIKKDNSEQSITKTLNNTEFGPDSKSPCINGALGLSSEVHASPSVFNEFMNTLSTSIRCPSSKYTHSVGSGKLKNSELMSMTFPSKMDSSFVATSHTDLDTDHLYYSKKMSTNKHSSQFFDLKNASSDDIFTMLDFFPSIDTPQVQSYPETNKDSIKSNPKHERGNKMSKFGNSFHRNQVIGPISKESTAIESFLTMTDLSQGQCSTKRYDQNNIISLPSNNPSLNCITKIPQISSISTMSPYLQSNQMKSLDQFSGGRSPYLNPKSCLSNSDKNPCLYKQDFSSIHAPVDNGVKNASRKRIRSKQLIMWYDLVQARKHKLNLYNTRSNGFVRTHSHSSCDRSIKKVKKIDESQWQIVPSESIENRDNAQIDNQRCHSSEQKRVNMLLEESMKEKQSLKVTFKRYPSTDCSISHTRLQAQDHHCKIGLKKSIIIRQAHVVGDSSSNDENTNSNTHCLRSENGEREKSKEENKDVNMCVTCDLNVSNEKHSKCGKGHIICSACLEPQVRVILSGDTKQNYIKCPSSSCIEVVHSDELKRTLPSFVVEILEEKLDKEYMNYITKWMFTDEQLKSRSEFATLDMSMVSCPTLSTNKFDEIDSPRSNDMAEDFPPFWAQMEREAPVMAFEVVPDTDEYRALACQFYETLNFGDYDIVKIIRIQNQILWKYFALKQSEMAQENDGVKVEEKQLYHGTHRSTLEAIARKGFDWRLSGKHGTAYGCGSYFASNSSYSHAYTDRAGSGMSVKTGGISSYIQPASISLNSLLTGYTSSSNSPWFLNAHLAPRHLNIPSPPPAHGQLSGLNKIPNQVSINVTAGLTSGTTTNLSSERTCSKTFSSTTAAGPQIIKNYQGCSSFSNMFSQPFLHNGYYSQTQPSIKGGCFYTASPSTSSSKIGQLLTVPPCSENSLGYSSGQTNILGNNSRMSNAKGSMNANAPVNCSASTISQAYEKGTTDLTKTFARGSTCKTHFMFVARVLVGRYTVGKSGLKRPPPLDESNPFGKSYDSCVDHNLYPQIYVIFDRNQAYPEYIIEYNWHKG